jgi:hypothetical protein
MKKITAKEFYAMISKKPAIFEPWYTPIEITEYIDCEHFEITHLSPISPSQEKMEECLHTSQNVNRSKSPQAPLNIGYASQIAESKK